MFNKYEQAIYMCGRIIESYDYTKLVPAFGFGGTPYYIDSA
jgi:hypothetical protein